MHIYVTNDPNTAPLGDFVRESLMRRGHTIVDILPFKDGLGASRTEHASAVASALIEADAVVCLPYAHQQGLGVADAVMGMAIGLDKEVVLWTEELTHGHFHPSPVTWFERVWRGGGRLNPHTIDAFCDLFDLIQLKVLYQHKQSITLSQWRETGDRLISRSMGALNDVIEMEERLKQFEAIANDRAKRNTAQWASFGAELRALGLELPDELTADAIVAGVLGALR